MEWPRRAAFFAFALAGAAVSVLQPLRAQVPVEHGAVLVTVLGADGAPIPGVFVDILRFEGGDAPYTNLDLADARAARVVQRLPTSERGTVGLQLPVGVPYRIRVDHAPFAIEWRSGVFAGSECEIRLRPAATLSGTVSLDDGTPIEAATVELSAHARGERRLVQTDVQGRYAFERLQPGGLSVGVDTAAGSVMRGQDLNVAEGEALEADFSIDPGALVRGTVTDGATGKPIAGAMIGVGWTFDKHVLSDENGEYALQGLGGPFGNNFYCKAPGYCERQIDRPEPRPDGGVVPLDIALRRGFAVEGVIVDVNGRPAADVYVAAVGMTHDGQRQETDWESVRTDSAGRFRIEDLRAELSPVLFVRHELRATQVLPLEIGDGARDVELGEVALLPRRMVQGVVVDGEGRPISRIRVILRGAGRAAPDFLRGAARGHILASYLNRRELTTDAKGRFFFGDLPAGTFVLECDGDTTEVEVQADRDPAPIELTH